MSDSNPFGADTIAISFTVEVEIGRSPPAGRMARMRRSGLLYRDGVASEAPAASDKPLSD